jgi:hypothetical protein
METERSKSRLTKKDGKMFGESETKVTSNSPKTLNCIKGQAKILV